MRLRRKRIGANFRLGYQYGAQLTDFRDDFENFANLVPGSGTLRSRAVLTPMR